jgi:limonene-1,2-epoxide hydrolase
VSDPREVVDQFITAFIAAWPAGDASRLGPFFHEDAVFHNIPMEPVTGRAAIEAFFAGLMAMGGEVSVEMVHALASDGLVMTERIDRFSIGGREITLPIMGTIEIRDGLIAAWRDYFDMSQFTAQMSS